MGTLKSNLLKISQFSGTRRGRGIIWFYLLLLGSVQNVAPKSLYSWPLLNSTDIFTETTYEVTSTTTTRTTPWNHNVIKLDLNKYHGPEYVWEMKQDATKTQKFTRSDASKSFKIAIHLKDCNFDAGAGEYIEIQTFGKPFKWICRETTTSSASYYLDNYSSKEIQTSNKERTDTVHEVMDNLDEVSITPYFKFEEKESKKWKQRAKAVIIVNLYKDEPKGCPEDFFDCEQTSCPTTCCSDVSQGSKSASGKSHQRSPIVFSSSMFTSAFWSKKGSHTSRCIPEDLKCNQNPNCGKLENKDEMKEICFHEKYCECQRVCLTWNYVLTSLAIAILFIITPTAIVFALFHRRNVALERARLIRLAHMRMADLRGEFTMDDPANDRPPTYDEVYDIKEPPPCFCKAIAMQKEHDLRQQQQVTNCADETITTEAVDETVDGTVPKNEAIEFQNLGFQCSCASLNRGDEGEDSERDIPPTYSELSRRKNEGNTHANTEAESHDDREGTRSHIIQQQQHQQVSGLPAFEDVDLDKEESA